MSTGRIQDQEVDATADGSTRLVLTVPGHLVKPGSVLLTVQQGDHSLAYGIVDRQSYFGCCRQLETQARARIERIGQIGQQRHARGLQMQFADL